MGSRVRVPYTPQRDSSANVWISFFLICSYTHPLFTLFLYGRQKVGKYMSNGQMVNEMLSRDTLSTPQLPPVTVRSSGNGGCHCFLFLLLEPFLFDFALNPWLCWADCTLADSHDTHNLPASQRSLPASQSSVRASRSSVPVTHNPVPVRENVGASPLGMWCRVVRR